MSNKRKPRRNGKSNKPKDQSRSYKSKDDSVEKLENQRNDAKWYGKYPELIQTAASLSWNYALGAPIVINSDGLNPHAGAFRPGKEPGLVHSKFIPCYGIADDLGDPLNKCAVEVYSQLRFNKSGETSYMPADVMQYFAAMSGIYMFIGTLQRIYGCLNFSTPVNRYQPRDIVKALGFDFDDLLRNKANLNFFIDSLMVKAAKWNVPKDMTIMERHTFLCTNIFKDEDIERASLFAYSPEIIWKYDWNNARCEAIQFLGRKDGSGPTTRQHSWTYDELYAMGYELLHAVEHITDVYTISANILSAYDYDGLYKLAPITPMYTTFPIYRPEMLLQLHNSDYMGCTYDMETLHLTQELDGANKGALVFKPLFIGVHPFIQSFSKLIDLPFEKPTHDDIMESTRFKVSATYLSGGPTLDTMIFTVGTAGSEILTNYGVLNASGSVDDSFPFMSRYTEYMLGSSEALTGLEYSISLKINMAPIWPFLNGDPVTNKYQITQFFGDLANYAVLEHDKLLNLHEVALLSELAVERKNLIKL